MDIKRERQRYCSIAIKRGTYKYITSTSLSIVVKIEYLANQHISGKVLDVGAGDYRPFLNKLLNSLDKLLWYLFK